jgi:sugar porter (SP) family MFS transporter
LYISEIAPARSRGLLVAINQLTIVIGVLAAQFVNWCIARPVPEGLSPAEFASSWNVASGWRWMFAACAAPSLLFFVLALLIPESPRWLAKAGLGDRAAGILGRIGGPPYAAEALAEIKASLVDEDQHVRLGELFERRVLAVLGLGIFLAVFQQWCGINVIFNYAGEIFKQAGYNLNDTLTNIVMTGLVNLVFTFVALLTVDRLGRKPLMLFGAAALTVIYLAIGYCYQLKGAGGAVPNTLFLVLVLAAIGSYAMSLAPVTWVIISEIFPNRIRGTAMSIAVGFLWIACFLLTYTFPLFNAVLGAAATFWIYAAICVAGFGFILFRLPETKGKTLEKIEAELVS